MDAPPTQNRTDATRLRPPTPSLDPSVPQHRGVPPAPVAQTSAVIGCCASFYPCFPHIRTIKSFARSIEPKKRRPAAQGEPSPKFARPRSRWSSVITLPGRRTPSKVAMTPRTVLRAVCSRHSNEKQPASRHAGPAHPAPVRNGRAKDQRHATGHARRRPDASPTAHVSSESLASVPDFGGRHRARSILAVRLDDGGRDRSQSILRSRVVGFHPSLAELLPHPFQNRSEDVCSSVPDRPRPRPRCDDLVAGPT
jgi:hypothetical protein